MDPLSIAAAATSIIFTIVKSGKHFATIYGCYKEAQHSLFMLQTECTVLAAALSQIQAHFSGSVSNRIERLPQTVMEALEMSLLGCTMTLSILTEEIERLVQGIELSETLKRKDKAKYVWKEDVMLSLVQQLRGQSMALGLLLKAMDNASVDRILAIVESGRKYFDTIENDTASIRETHRSKRFPTSISELSTKETESLYDLLEGDPLDSSDLTPMGEPWEALGDQPTQKFRQRKPISRKPVMSKSTTPPPHSPGIYKSQPSPLPERSKLASFVQTTTSRTPPPVSGPPNLTPWALNTPQKLQNSLDTLIRSGRVPAVAVAIVSPKGADIFVRGVRKQGNNTLTTQNDLFGISPISGTMTVTVLARLIDRGLLSWTNTLDEVLPEYRELIHPGHQHTTLEMFGAHLSGISEDIVTAEDGQLWSYLYDTSISGHEGRRTTLLSYLRKPPDNSPGPTSYEWHSVNLMLIAMVIETVAGSTWETVTKAELFDPLEMYHTGFGQADHIRNSSSANPTQPWPHQPQAGGPPSPSNPAARGTSNPPALWPCDGIYSSLPDLCTFLRFYLYGPSDASFQSFLSPASWKSLTRPVQGTSITLGQLIQCTRNWAKGSATTTGGQGCGFAASLWVAPEIGKAFVCITNVEGEVGTAVADEAAILCTRF
ncbi:hypothetical protein FGG08_007091 [Glutinoglossum americanum]|uniref:Beta-lactamase-related domain-containing protein n=1 Tax=Glutinoglossum americanum TaxID=1670608 RepID=A0A9P8I622_9PEZI|nr:hypothetical protein FGG08_007091 [Glutinoglossum americanum]